MVKVYCLTTGTIAVILYVIFTVIAFCQGNYNNLLLERTIVSFIGFANLAVYCYYFTDFTKRTNLKLYIYCLLVLVCFACSFLQLEYQNFAI